jgi:GH35 family endo-1,4-beta-xylanase
MDLYDAKQRIKEIRKKDVEVVVLKDGRPVGDARVRVEMRRHQFLFGCNNFFAFAYDEETNRRFKEYFAALFNYATLPFYWAQYEPEPGNTQEARLRRLVNWAKDIGAATKGHPLVWEKLSPEWLTDAHDIGGLIQKRLEEIMRAFGDDIDFWDLFNEITVAFQYANPMANWIHQQGKARAVRFAAEAVRRVKPDANLLYNDFYIWKPDCEVLLDELRHMGVELQALGLQSHMHEGLWSLEETWNLCQRYARFGWPLHFTEFTVLSGRYRGLHPLADDSKPEDWYTDQDFLDQQARHTADTYTLLFSHPAVEAITWWDFQDGDWRGAPAGVVTQDIRQKPVYRALRRLIREEWWSDAEGVTNPEGVFAANVFCGEYAVTVTAGGVETALSADIFRDRYTWRPQRVVVRL